MKKIACLITAALLVLAFAGCAKTKVLHCDSCNKEIIVNEKSDMDENWGVYCDECNEKLFGNNPVLSSD